MKVGDAAQLQVPGIADPVDAKVALISPALDPGSTTLEVWVKADNKKGELKVGTPVKIVITGRTVEKAWKIPQAAVLTAQDGSKSVMVVGADGAAHKKPVTLGITDGEDVQVLNGIAPGDTVITGGAYGLDEGTKVKVGEGRRGRRGKAEGRRRRLMSTVTTEKPAAESFWLARSTRTIFFFAAVLTLAGIYFAFQVPISVFPETNFPRVVIGVDNGVMPVEQMEVTHHAAH